MKLNQATQEGWILSPEYREYRMTKEQISPEEWNSRIRAEQNSIKNERRGKA